MDIKQCRIHPERKAEIWLCGAGTEVCRPCADAFSREVGHGRNSYDRNATLGWIQRQTSVMCPGCAHEAAIVEDAQRELDAFLHEIDNTVRGGFE